MNSAQVGGAILVVVSAVVSFALLPQPDFVLPAAVKFVLGCVNVATTTLALYLNVRMPGASRG